MRTLPELSMACICGRPVVVPKGVPEGDDAGYVWPRWMDEIPPRDESMPPPGQFCPKAEMEHMLRAHELVGLFIPGRCACLLNNLMPCGEIRRECRPGYRLLCRNEAGDETGLFCLTDNRGHLPDYCPRLRNRNHDRREAPPCRTAGKRVKP